MTKGVKKIAEKICARIVEKKIQSINTLIDQADRLAKSGYYKKSAKKYLRAIRAIEKIGDRAQEKRLEELYMFA